MLILYYHGGSSNHGCEAIVRSTKKILKQDLVLQTTNIEDDRKYDLQSVVKLQDDSAQELSRTQRLCAAIYHKMNHGSDMKYIAYQHDNFFSTVKKGDICFSIGGDNYCYTGQEKLAYYNEILHKKNAKTILWGCSVEPNIIHGKIAEDLARYDLIVARESFSFDALKKVNPNTILCCDPAFQLDQIDFPLSPHFIEKNTVGINLSPLIMGCEGDNGITLKNYLYLIKYILNNTDMNVALIPHVVINGSDDRKALQMLYNEFPASNRICIVEDCNCEVLKGYIARCRFLITARTHASIAAYSTCVPTLVVGYSVKARGIAKDIFGTDEHYVVPVQNLQSENQITEAFKWIIDHEVYIINILEQIMPSYKESILNIKIKI